MTDNEIKPYQRYGYVPAVPPRLCDKLISQALERIPADAFLPTRWRHGGDAAKFQRKYGNHKIVWALGYSCCTLLVNGFHIIRIWTASYSVMVDLHEDLRTDSCESIPPTCTRKSKPLYSRLKLHTEADCTNLIHRIKRLYGI